MTVTANAPSTADNTLWHALPTDDVVEQLATSIDRGLEAGEAQNRLRKYGPNRLPEGKKQSAFMRFVQQFNNILVYVLLGAGFTKLMLGLWLDAGIIFGVVLLNALLGFIQEGKAEKALDSIRNMLSAEARTMRGGETRMIPAEELVPGDIVLLESGDKVPADLRLAEAKNLRTEEAALTGESVPAEKTTDPVAEKATVGDRESMAFSGHDGGVRPRDRRRGRHRQRDRTRQASTSCSPASARSKRRCCARSRSSATLITGVIGVVGVAGIRLWPLGDGHGHSSSCSRRSSALRCR